MIYTFAPQSFKPAIKNRLDKKARRFFYDIFVGESASFDRMPFMVKTCVYFAHGQESGPWGTKITRLAQVAQAKGCDVHSPDYSKTQNADERVAMLLALKPQIEGRLILVGSSMGGYVATVASQTLKPDGLFLMAPAFYPPTQKTTGLPVDKREKGNPSVSADVRPFLEKADRYSAKSGFAKMLSRFASPRSRRSQTHEVFDEGGLPNENFGAKQNLKDEEMDLTVGLHIPGYKHQSPRPCAKHTVLVHGWQDDVVPVEHSLRFAQEHAVTAHILKSDHRLTNVLPVIEQLFIYFLDQVFKPTGS